MTKSYDDLMRANEAVKFSTIDQKACDEYDAYVAVLPANVYKLSVRIQTKTECIIVESPMFRFVYDAVRWYKNLSYVDSEMFAYLGYRDENDDFVFIAEMEEM